MLRYPFTNATRRVVRRGRTEGGGGAISFNLALLQHGYEYVIEAAPTRRKYTTDFVAIQRAVIVVMMLLNIVMGRSI